MKFKDVDLVPEIQEALEKIGFTDCTPVQAQVLPVGLEGKDVSALSQTGTGKTAAFMLPLMDRVIRSMQGWAEQEGLTEEDLNARKGRVFPDWKRGHFVLVLVPTRELAEQVYQDYERFKGNSALGAAVIYGGTGYEEQKALISKGVQFVIGTPGRLIDLYKSHILDFRQVRALVFDEADRMFDMGFKDDMRFIFQRVPKTRQVFMFSATMNYDVLHTAYMFGVDPVEFNLSKDQVKAENVEDSIYHVGADEKPKFLLSVLKKENPKLAIIFSNFKSNVELISAFLNKNGIPAMGISSLLTQSQRNRVISMFKEGTGQHILVATDLAARGLDVKNVDLVINADLPDDPENYVHRIGRTGRAGSTGRAFSLVSDRDVDALVRIEEYLKHKLTVNWFEESDLVTEFHPPEYERPERPKWQNRDGRPQRDARSGGGKSRRPDRPSAGGGSAGSYKGQRPEKRGASSTASQQQRRGGRPQEQMAHKSPSKGGHKTTTKPSHKPYVAKNAPKSTQKKKSVGLVSKVKGLFKGLFK